MWRYSCVQQHQAVVELKGMLKNGSKVFPRRYAGSKKAACLAIRRETVNAWERRAPLAPKHVKKLTENGVKVLVQPSNRRAFPLPEYIQAGATIQEDLSEASLVVGVKQVPVECLSPGKTYAFFSHTIKAQRENMPLLDAILQKNIRLLDYEKMVDEDGVRLVAFGKWAGYCGLINILHGLGLRLLALGHHTPFLHIGLAHNYRDKHMAINAIRDAGYEIALDMLPRSLGPITFVFTGNGNVSQGAQELFQHFPHEFVDVATLPKVARHGKMNKLYACVVERWDHLVRKDGGKYDDAEWMEHPERYRSNFAEKVAPYSSVIINGIFWIASHPRLIAIPDAKSLFTPHAEKTPSVPGCPNLPHRLLAICDISADPGGSIEFVTECTTIDKPFIVYDADSHKNTDNFDSENGILVCSIDNMPAQMPREATEFFGDKLLPFIPAMLASDATEPFENYKVDPTVRNAIIASNGKLTPNFEYIADLRRQNQIQSAHKTGRTLSGDTMKVLLLGAGMVTPPVVDYLRKDKNVVITAAGNMKVDLERLADMSSCVHPVTVDIQKDPDAIERLVKENDVVISLLPYAFHPQVARMCIRHATNMVTSSYLSPEMKSLHQAALDAGITIVNEAGLDPGIDHMLAKECIDDVHSKDGKITSFISYCGGLPAPEASENPLRYKFRCEGTILNLARVTDSESFSWSPKGALLSLKNPAKYLQNGGVVEVPGEGGILDQLQPMDFMPGFNLVGYPNRDSTVYADIYDIPEVKTILRGTLRYQGFAEAIKGMTALGLLSDDALPILDPLSGPEVSWKQVMAHMIGQKEDIFEASLKNLVAEKLGETSSEFKAINELGLLSESVMVQKQGTPLDSLAAFLADNLAYQPGEKDLVVLRHDIGIRWPNASEEIHHVNFVMYGDPNGYSAMASTVGYTAAIVARMVFTGEIQRKGMVLPLTNDIYRPVLMRLKQLGMKATSHRTLL